jgi:HAD superfamily hydrolase (TIGR01509 family)
LSRSPQEPALRAILFDAGNTLVFLDYARLAQGVGSALSLPLTGEDLAAHAPAASEAMERAGGNDQQRAAVYLETLFQLGGVPPERMGEVRSCLARMHGERHLWCSVKADSADSLGRLRAAGFKLGVISNSDGRVVEALEVAGLRQYFDVIIDSALVGLEKPDPRIFRAALEALGVEPEEALYVGDRYEVDVRGAEAAGIRGVLFDPPVGGRMRPCKTISSIQDLADDLLRAQQILKPPPKRNNHR